MEADRIWWGRTLKSRRMRSMKAWSWRSPKMSFIYKDEERIFLLEEEKKKSGGKSEFIWRFGEFFLFPLFFSFFSLCRSWGKRREDYRLAFHLERTSRRLKGNHFHWNERKRITILDGNWNINNLRLRVSFQSDEFLIAQRISDL